MSPNPVHRRAVLAAGAAMLCARALPAMSADSGTAIHVLKDPSCGCCAAWIEIVAAEGFAVTVELTGVTELTAYKVASGIPEAMASCHTARVDGYMVEGHVPVADIRRLLAERPDAVGLAAPGMPWGSPGMGPESERDAYDVFLIGRDGSSTAFSRYDAA